ncbi:unnamed protein product [Rotaria sp. Silwood2]|nr:unnamed protein product [Rotaria sp. Silwood2]CAF3078043.1 unnamed protein product [Rotaria sp. Silwood2]CAF3381987.1 unnamed protein product [Rotaria sp. Silwood2]CAF4343674.1 unnamed protein product [Rotaria sp. Silwood2]CAF4391545.1 unnamed protein product [Rotaria sp. Silwood2]
MEIFWLFMIITLIKAEDHQFKCPLTKALIQSLLDDAYIPGAAIIVVKPNEIIYEEGIGYHSPPISEPRQPIDPSTSIFLLGSVSKTFIVVAAM